MKITDRETLQGNIQVVRALSDGLHPLTGQAVAPNDPAAQERMKTCFGYVARALERALELGFFSAKAPFRLSREKWNSLSPSAEACTLSEFLRTVNAGLDDPTAVQSLSTQELADFLEAEGLVAKATSSTGWARLVPTSEGERLGITFGERRNEKGEPYQIMFYPPETQRLLIAKLEQFVRD